MVEKSSNLTPAVATVPSWRPRVFHALLVFLLVFVFVIAAISAFVFWPRPTFALVTFREGGLPSGRTWSAIVDNITYLSSIEIVTLHVAPGTYRYQVALVTGTDYLPVPASGHVVATASGVSVSIEFIRSEANVTVLENGLPPETPWVLAEGSNHYSSNTSSVTITEPDGTHSLRVLAQDKAVFVSTETPRILDDLFLPNVSLLVVNVNGSDIFASVHFTIALHLNYSAYAVPVFPNETALGSPAYEYMALTFYRYTTVNYSFHGGPQGVDPYPNVTAYLLSPSEFDAFKLTGNISEYLLASGNVSLGSWSLNFAPGVWIFMLTGWSVNEFHAAGWSWGVSFPGIQVFYS